MLGASRRLRSAFFCPTASMFLLSLCLGFLALVLAMSWDLFLEVNTDAPANVNVSLPEVHWIFYALPAIVFLVAFCVLLKRLIVAWRGGMELRVLDERTPH